jgi:transposase
MPRLLFARPPADAAEERAVRRLAGARHAPADWIRRARIIELSWARMRVPAIAAQLGCSAKTVRCWVGRFTRAGLDGLADRPGTGRRPRIPQTERSQIIMLARQDPPGRLVRDGAGELSAADESAPGVWTLDSLTEVARDQGIDIHRSQVRRILRAEHVRWRHPRSWTTSDDAEFVPKGPGSWGTTRNRRHRSPSSAGTSSAR